MCARTCVCVCVILWASLSVAQPPCRPLPGSAPLFLVADGRSDAPRLFPARLSGLRAPRSLSARRPPGPPLKARPDRLKGDEVSACSGGSGGHQRAAHHVAPGAARTAPSSCAFAAVSPHLRQDFGGVGLFGGRVGGVARFQRSVRSALVPAAPPRSMVVEDASILSPVKPDRTMASDSPARSLDEIDLSALRVSAPSPPPPAVRARVHVQSVSVCACA